MTEVNVPDCYIDPDDDSSISSSTGSKSSSGNANDGDETTPPDSPGSPPTTRPAVDHSKKAKSQGEPTKSSNGAAKPVSTGATAKNPSPIPNKKKN